MNTDDNDIVKIDLPPYAEEQSPFPDIEPDFNFEDNKEEIYLRNRIIAAQEQVKLLKEEERKRLEKQEKFREMTQAAKAADRAVKAADRAAMAAKQKQYWDKLVLPVSIITVCAIISLIVVLSGRLSKPPVSVYDLSYEESLNYLFAEMRLTETTMAVTQTETEVTQVSQAPVVTETEVVTTTYDERKFTAVREPFEAAEGETVVNTTAMSYKIKNASAYSESQYGSYDTIPGSASVTAEITIKNLTDYDYAVNMIFFNVSAGTNKDNGVTVFSGYDEDLAEYSETGDLLWLHFDENNLCSFTVTVSNYSFKKDHLNIEYDFVKKNTELYDKVLYAKASQKHLLDIFKYEIDREGMDVKIEIPEDKREVVTVE